MTAFQLTLQLAGDDDFLYIYRLCELTMRRYVEADLGDCFEKVARPTIQNLLKRGRFFLIYADDVRVGAVAFERHETHIQLEELYVESERQHGGIGSTVMRRLIDESDSSGLPICLHVLASNPAREFYGKLGFTVTRTKPEVKFMQYLPASTGSDA